MDSVPALGDRAAAHSRERESERDGIGGSMATVTVTARVVGGRWSRWNERVGGRMVTGRRQSVPARASSSAAVSKETLRAKIEALRGENERMRAEIMGGALGRAPARVDAVETEAATEAEEPVVVEAKEPVVEIAETVMEDATTNEMEMESEYGAAKAAVVRETVEVVEEEAEEATSAQPDTAMFAEQLPERPVVVSSSGRAPIEQTEKPMQIVFVSSEVAPWSKTGGLADVCGSLPQALVARGHRVMVIAPRYQNGSKSDVLYDGAFDTCVKSKVGCFGGEQEVGFFHQIKNDVDYVFVDHPSFHRKGGLYGDSHGVYGDNQFRFTLLSHAACEAPLVLPFTDCGGYYGQDVVFVANDWHAGLVPTLVASRYRPHGVYKDARTICAIHNILHQGVEPATTFPNLGVPNEWYGALEYKYPEHMRAHELDEGLVVNILKSAIATCDRVLTVSQGYAFEITTPEGGKGMEGLLQSRTNRLDGIANGIDMDEWNPEADVDCEAPFSVVDLSGKLECKRALQKELGLPQRDDVPLMGFIGRLDWQKGPDLLQNALHDMMREDVQVVMLGSGLPELEDFMRWAEETYKDKFRGWVGFSVPMAHRITAGCDILLMPSRFEPCGLNQLYAMRYGTLPIAHATGGLKDTITPHNAFGDADKVLAGTADMDAGEGVGTGWLFNDMNADALMWAIRSACDVYRTNPNMWRAMQTQAMTQDLSWDNAAKKWEKVFEWSKIDPPHAN